MKFSTRKIVLTALMIALVFLITYLPFLHIPSPIAQGYFNIGDSAIMITAILLGRSSGLIAGALGSALADLLGGYILFAPFTFVVKGIEGFLVGMMAGKKGNQMPSAIKKLIALVTGAIVMAAGYLFFELTVIRFLDKSLAVTAVLAELPGNLIQGGVSAVIAYIFIAVLERTKIIKKL